MTRMDWYPKAVHRPIESKIRSRSGWEPNAFVLHIAAGEAPSLFDFFSNPKRGCSHFYNLKSGALEQYLPISSRSMADVNGNRRAVSIEHQGGSILHRKEPFTEEQVIADAELLAWLHEEWGVPLVLMPNSQTKTAGVGYHRLGIDGNFPSDDLYAGRQQRGGGELWSHSTGKTCPENFALPLEKESRIIQIPAIIQAAIDLSGVPVEPPVVVPPPVIHPPVEPDDGKIAEDGYWGRDTTSFVQMTLGTPVDGEVWRQNERWDDDNPGLTHGWVWNGKPGDNGSPMIHALYRHLRSKGISARILGEDDGKIGPKHIKGIQTYVGTTPDGELWAPSPAIEEVQRMLNEGKF